jgi:hypothetical protein
MKKIFLSKVEKELLYDEYWSLWQQTKLPPHLELETDKEEFKRDIWSEKKQTEKPKLSIKILLKQLVIKFRKNRFV